MLYEHYIKMLERLFLGFKIILRASFCCMIIFLSACSVTPEPNGQSDDSSEVKSIGKQIIELLSFPDNDVNNKANKQPTRVKQISSDASNVYLEQEALLMTGVPNDVVDLYEQAIQSMEQKNWHEALTLFNEVINKYESSSSSYVNQAIIWKELSKLESNQETQQIKLDKSEQLLDLAIKTNSLNPYAQLYKGQHLQDKGQFIKAEEYYLAALTIWPNYPEAQLNMAILLELYRGKLLEAHQYYSAFLKNHAEDKQVQRWQAALAIKIKRAGLTLPEEQGE